MLMSHLHTRSRIAVLLTASLVFLVSSGCTPGPSEVVTAYLDAQIDGDGEEAWSKLSTDTQERLSKEHFTSDSPAAKKLRETYLSELDFSVVDTVVERERAEVVVQFSGPDIAEVIRGEHDPPTTDWFRVYRLIREPERQWTIQLDSTLPSAVQTVSGVYLHRFFDVLEQVVGVHERALDIFERGLDLGDRFLDIFEKELDRAQRHDGPGSPDLPPPPSGKKPPKAAPEAPEPPPSRTEPQSPPPPSNERAESWQTKTVRDPMTDEIQRVFWTHARDTEGTRQNLRLDLWCAGGDTRVFVHTGDLHGFKSDNFDFDHATVRTRVSDAAVDDVRGTLSENRRRLELPNGTKRMLVYLQADPKNLRVEVPTPFDGRRVGVFDLGGLSDVADEHRAECVGE
jgi:hypothetical protein